MAKAPQATKAHERLESAPHGLKWKLIFFQVQISKWELTHDSIKCIIIYAKYHQENFANISEELSLMIVISRCIQIRSVLSNYNSKCDHSNVDFLIHFKST